MSSKRSITETELRELYLERRLLDAEIGEMFGLSGAWVNDLRKKWGIPTIPKWQRTAMDAETLRRLYVAERRTDQEIGDMYGRTGEWVRTQRLRYGIPTIPATERADIIPKKEFERLYLREKLTLDEIAERYGIRTATVIQYRKKYGIPTLTETQRRSHIFPIEDKRRHKSMWFAGQIIRGTVLGDAHLSKPKVSARIEMKHAISQRRWLEFKKAQASVFLEMSPIRRLKPTPSPGWNCQDQVRTVSRSHPWLTELYPMLYKEDGTKYINADYLNTLDWPAVAAWFLDDASFSRRAYTLSTNCFSEKDHEIIAEWFMQAWGVRVNVAEVPGRPGQLTSRLSVRSSRKVQAMVERLTRDIPTMRYKAGEATQLQLAI